MTLNPFPDKQAAQVLIVDDQRVLREMMRSILMHEGYCVLAAENGDEAIALLRAAHEQERPIPLVLLDLLMPVRDGIDVLHWLDQHPEIRGESRVIVISGANSDHLAGQHPVLAAPFVAGRLTKPIDVPAAVRLIRNLLAP